MVEALEHFLGEEVPDNMKNTVEDQAAVFLKALGIFYHREYRYRGGWKTRGWRGNVCDILRKAARVKSMYWIGNFRPDSDEGAMDDVFDLINYSGFFVRNAHYKNEWGQ